MRQSFLFAFAITPLIFAVHQRTTFSLDATVYDSTSGQQWDFFVLLRLLQTKVMEKLETKYSKTNSI
jgi:hypothetical protein